MASGWAAGPQSAGGPRATLRLHWPGPPGPREPPVATDSPRESTHTRDQTWPPPCWLRASCQGQPGVIHLLGTGRTRGGIRGGDQERRGSPTPRLPAPALPSSPLHLPPHLHPHLPPAPALLSSTLHLPPSPASPTAPCSCPPHLPHRVAGHSPGPQGDEGSHRSEQEMGTWGRERLM